MAGPAWAGASEADSLFEQGRARMAAGDYAAACQNFEESYRLDPATGTRLGLALCHEEQGLFATALNEFLAVAAASKSDGHAERGVVARKHIASLGLKVSKLTFDLAPEARALGALQVECDGVRVDVAANAELPVDPGTHVIVASAPEHVRWATGVQVGTHVERVVVQIPALAPNAPVAEVAPHPPAAPLPAAAPPVVTNAPPPRPAPELSYRSPESAPHVSSPLPTRRVLGIVIAGLGVVAVGVGAAEGLHASSENEEAHARCPSSPCASPSAVALSHSALDAATASDILFGVGAVALGVGAYLWWTVPRAPVAVNVGLQRAEVRLQW